MSKSITRLRALLSSPRGFSSGTKIYEPEDTDALAPEKRQIISLAVSVSSERLKGGGAQKRWTIALQKSRIDVGRIHDVERSDYAALIRAIEDVVCEGSDVAKHEVAGRCRVFRPGAA